MNSKDFQVAITHVGVKGEGVGIMADGRRVFVAGTLPGENVVATPVSERPQGLSARLVTVIDASPARTVPPCRYFQLCGGCSLQHMKSDAYEDHKRSRVLLALSQAGVAADKADGPLVSPPHSRRRAVFSAKCAADGMVQFGFNERASHRLVEIESCEILVPGIVALLPLLRRQLAVIMRSGESYDVAIGGGGADIAAPRLDVLVTVLGAAARPCDAAVRQALRTLAESATGGALVSRISWQASRLTKPETIYDDRGHFFEFGRFAVVPPPGGFLQATAAGQAALADFALKKLAGRSRVADLYAGCGTFALALLSAGHHVDAFEADAAALAALREAAKGQSNIGAHIRNLARSPLGFQELKVYDAVIVDPPRVGAQPQMREIVRSGLRHVVSISCNPDSFARDAAILTQGGFRLKHVLIVDQFLWSHHVEIAGYFIKR